MNDKGPSGPLFPFAVLLGVAGVAWIVAVAGFIDW